ncbi:MAG: Asp-tRNA(Asn)/Glu-tRNA(Gln) amidotransferase subunit GatA [Bacillota bacterium]
MSLLQDLRATSLLKLLKAREITAEEITAAVLGKISEVDKQINAYITVTGEQALAQARQADRALARGGDIPPLAGVPMGIKDNICTAGVKTTCGSLMLAGYTPHYSATAVERLGQAGAVMAGKTNLDEFGLGNTNKTSYFGATRNPLDPARMPGGSSGGSAAAVAAGEASFALGTDAGGSIRQPASYCGVVGLKPTFGLVSGYGVIDFAPSLDTVGPLTLDVQDCALVLQAMAGRDPLHPMTEGAVAPDYSSFLGRDIRGLKIGLVREYFGPEIAPGVKSRVLAAAEKLDQLGTIVEETSLPHAAYAAAAYLVISTAEAFSNLSNFDGVRFGHRTGGQDLHNMYRRTRFEAFGPDLRQKLIFGALVLGAGHYEEYFVQAQKIRTLIKRELKESLRRYDLLLTPATPDPAPALANDDSLAMRNQDMCLLPANLAGLPAITLPCGSLDNLPVGLQFMAAPYAEGLLLQVACALEQQLARPWA